MSKLEIIVVDDGSTDNTLQTAKTVQRKHPEVCVKVVRQENAGKAHALNNGIKNYATGKLIMCLDADSCVASKAIANGVQHFRNPRVKGISANVKIIKQRTLLNLIQRSEYIVCYQMKRAQTYFNIEYIIGGIGSMFRKSTLERVGYYDTDTITEDIDLTMKILRLGNKSNKVVYAADMIAYTESCLSMKALLRQRYRWKWGRSQTFIKNTSMFFNTDRKYSKGLTFVYLPYALYGDISFLFEPLMAAYIFFVAVYYRDPYTLASAALVLSMYTGINILAEDTLPLRERLSLLFFVPVMYFLFYVLSFAEYVALIRTLFKVHTLKRSIREQDCSWQHVERSGSAFI